MITSGVMPIKGITVLIAGSLAHDLIGGCHHSVWIRVTDQPIVFLALAIAINVMFRHAHRISINGHARHFDAKTPHQFAGTLFSHAPGGGVADKVLHHFERWFLVCVIARCDGCTAGKNGQ